MCKILLLVICLLAVLMALPVLFYYWLGWMGFFLSLVLVAVLVVIGKMLGGRLLQRLFLAPFKAKGAVLRDAEARVHMVTPTNAPDTSNEPNEYTDGEEWQEADEEVEEPGHERVAYRYYYVDATITPGPTSGQSFTLWEPGELSLASPNTKHINPDDDDDFGVVENVKIWNNGEWQDDEGLKYDGPLRIQLHVGIPPEADSARFRYYFEVFGQINFQGDNTSDLFSESR